MSINIKKVICVSLSVLSLNASATALQSNKNLAKQCRELAHTVASLVFSQQKDTCSEKLALASVKIAGAANFILGNEYSDAKQGLYGATLALQFAELNNCKRFIQIAHAKLETQKIKNSI